MNEIVTERPMVRLWLLLALFVTLKLFATAPAHAAHNLSVEKQESGNRVALVIGNAAYPGVAALKNPANDATDIATKLKKLGFDVTLKTDISLRQMLRTLSDFGDKVVEGSEALFFYAGHGMQVKGRNYLIPIDAQIRTESHASSEAVDVDQLLDKLSRARLSMVILDACRNNPFERRFRGGGQGLAQINAPTGTLIAYATAPGKVAADGDGRNGLYTQELLKAMDAPGIKVEDVFKRVRSNVIRLSQDAQTPWESSSLTGDFYFIFSGPTSVNMQQVQTDPEIVAWQVSEQANTISAYKAYISAYPKGLYLTAARIALDALQKTAPNISLHIKSGDQKSGATAPLLAPTSVAFDYPNQERERQEGEKDTLQGTSGRMFMDCPNCPEMVVIPQGSFKMGSKDVGSKEKPVHTVIISQSFALARTEITQRQWRNIMGGDPPEMKFKDCDMCPVESVSWSDAMAFLLKLNSKTGKTYRLPSEAEWEYACQAGGVHLYCGSDDVEAVAWFESNSNGRTHSVAQKQPNAWGLYDMSGNVWEWTEDCWNENYNEAPDSEKASIIGNCEQRVLRGGSWLNVYSSLYSTKRKGDVKSLRNIISGFRPVRVMH